MASTAHTAACRRTVVVAQQWQSHIKEGATTIHHAEDTPSQAQSRHQIQTLGGCGAGVGPYQTVTVYVEGVQQG